MSPLAFHNQALGNTHMLPTTRTPHCPLLLPTLCVARCPNTAPRTGVLRQWSRAVTRSLSRATAVLLGKGAGGEEEDEGYEERQEEELAARGGRLVSAREWDGNKEL